ncbi:MAG TPA: HAMP domain-containing sensor histidine kinase [Actinomycetota bacterium]|nr:HAMP domain-containing sensor histidine kinase [Actinomycetota bacterium]
MPTADEGPGGTDPQGRGPRLGIRARILLVSIAALVLAVTMAVFAVRQVLFAQIDDRIDEGLVQEANELRRLAGGRDPATGEPFDGDVARVFDVFLERNVPQRNETYVTFVGGEPYERTFRQPPYRLDLDVTLVERWRELRDPDRGTAFTPAGRVEYLAVPIVNDGATRGVFVAAFFRDIETEEVRLATIATAGVGFLMVLFGAVVVWRVAEGILRPVRRATDAARDISTSDLTRRMPVSGNDEIADLGRTFNELLGRLEEAFDTQQRFVDDAGHELRTPITIIRGHLELMDEDPGDRARTLVLVEDELDRMQRIVNDLLTLAKAERPDFLTLEPVKLDVLAGELLAKAQALGDRRWTLADTPRGTIVADRQRVTQAVMQLAQNAVQHTRDGDPIELGMDVRAGEVSLWVRDRGRGIAPEELDRIFERFARGRGPRPSDGAGLGLAIVRAIAEAHRGRVTVESTEGRGATFAIVVPVDQPEVGDG